MKPRTSDPPPPAGALPPRERERIRLPLTIPCLPYLKDHHIGGQVILPAVEILQRLAGSLKAYRPNTPVRHMRGASFDRFLPIDPDAGSLTACHKLAFYDDGHASSRLETTTPVPGTGMKRTKVHAVVDFVDAGASGPPLPLDMAAALEGIADEVPAGVLYRDLVPFGPAYRNVRGSLFLSEHGAVCQVSGGDHRAPSSPLGSPFPLDGALHAACAWGQRFRHIVAFPVGFEERMIFKPTATGERYHCRILPRSSAGKALCFDIWIYDLEGGLREMARGVVMKEISLGRTRPSSLFPDRVAVSLATIRDHCRAYAVIDVQTVAGFAAGALSIAEAKRFAPMGPKRRQTFLMGRLALKLLSRKLSGGNWETPASNIHTVMPDGLRPRCPVPGGHSPIFCSLSHDARFAVAVAGDGEVGVDVERISERILKVRRKFMDPEEMALTEASPLGVMEASIRAWSIKEGVVKATGRHLAESWRAAKIADIGYDRSRLTVLGIRYESFHDIVGDHIFTLVKRVD